MMISKLHNPTLIINGEQNIKCVCVCVQSGVPAIIQLMHELLYDIECGLAITYWLSMIISLSVIGLKAWCMNAERAAGISTPLRTSLMYTELGIAIESSPFHEKGRKWADSCVCSERR